MGNEISFGAKPFTYPAYYTEVNPTAEDAVAANQVWDLVLNNTAKKFIEMKLNPDFQKESSLTWFY